MGKNLKKRRKRRRGQTMQVYRRDRKESSRGLEGGDSRNRKRVWTNSEGHPLAWEI